MSATCARFDQFGLEPQEVSSPFPTSSSSSTSIPASASTSPYKFSGEMGIFPSATMLAAPVQHHSIPFVSARTRIAEFESLREELRKTEIAREKQVERLYALASDSMSFGLGAPQVRIFFSPFPLPYLFVSLYALSW